VGPAMFGADVISSIAHAPQETLAILAVAGTQAFGYAFPISVVVTLSLALVTIPFRKPFVHIRAVVAHIRL
jgi:hypothetical protein